MTYRFKCRLTIEINSVYFSTILSFYEKAFLVMALLIYTVYYGLFVLDFAILSDFFEVVITPVILIFHLIVKLGTTSTCNAKLSVF